MICHEIIKQTVYRQTEILVCFLHNIDQYSDYTTLHWSVNNDLSIIVDETYEQNK